MRLLRCVVLVIVLMLGWAVVPPGLAWAKGPIGVEIDGPGLQEPLVVEMHSPAAETMWALQEQVGLLVGAQTLTVPPAGELGDVYRLTWFFSESRERDRVEQDVYPWAAGGPVVHTLPGETDWHRLIPAGWTRGGAGLAEAFTRLGVPLGTPAQPEAEIPAMAAAPRNSVGPVIDTPWLVISAVVAVLIVGVGVAASFVHRRGTLRV